jgi:tetratricopeptide (TPR) repeat protein
MKDAIDHFKAVLEQSPEDELAMFSLGRACYEAGEYGEARENLMRAVDRKKDWMAAWILLGQCEMALGHRDAAREILQKAHQLAVIQNHRGPLAETKRLLAELDQDA